MATPARDARPRSGGASGSGGALYQIRIRGHLGAYGAAWFEGLTVVNLANGDALLTGRLADQAALLGVLNRVHAVGLCLLAVNCVWPARGRP
jgi:hypothetical protein